MSELYLRVGGKDRWTEGLDIENHSLLMNCRGVTVAARAGESRGTPGPFAFSGLRRLSMSWQVVKRRLTEHGIVAAPFVWRRFRQHRRRRMQEKYTRWALEARCHGR